MSKEFPGRIHGDGHLIMDISFYCPLNKKESIHYANTLKSIIKKANIGFEIDQADPGLPNTLLALKQRFMIGFSNGCPWPEKIIGKYLSNQEQAPTNLDDLTKLIKKSGHADGKHSFLFQDLLANSSQPLKNEILNYHPWQKIAGQEDHNLPEDITNSKGKGGYGMAYNPPFYEVLVPLYKYIDDKKNPGTQEARYFAVSDFFGAVASKTKSIKALIVETNKFLSNSSVYLGPYLENENHSDSLNAIYL